MTNNTKMNAETIVVCIKQVLGRYPDICLAILFGSLSKGQAGRDSGLDVAVDMGRPLVVQKKINLIAELAEATGRPVDLVDLRVVGEPLLGQIIVTGLRILGDDMSFAFMLSKHLY